MRDVPVAVRLGGVLAQEVTAFAETEAGWQVVGLDGPPRPVVVLADRPHDGCPTVVITDGAATTAQVSAHLVAGAVDVVGWPHERERLLAAPARVSARTAPPDGVPVLRIAGATGGAGTSTFALAAAALLAWRGRRALVVADDDLLPLCGLRPWQGPGAIEVAALDHADAAAEVTALRRPVAGVDDLHVLGGGGLVAGTAGWPADVVIADGGTTGRAAADVLCARPDVGLGRLVGTDAPVVVVGAGPLDRPGVRAALGAAPVGWLPESARVATAALAGRVPSSLPGSWLRAVHRVLTRVGRSRG